jgi:NADH:ubiquinone oxidoreductase subunit K
MSTSTSASTRSRGVTTGTALKTGAAAGVLAAIANVAVSAIARGPFDASDEFVPLTPSPIVLWTIVGAIIGAIGWRLIVMKKVNSRALLARLVPTVLVLSFLPDLALLATDTMPGQTTAGVLALMVMHVLTAVIAVTAYRKAMPAS